jgi:hypothetical protein
VEVVFAGELVATVEAADSGKLPVATEVTCGTSATDVEETIDNCEGRRAVDEATGEDATATVRKSGAADSLVG